MNQSIFAGPAVEVRAYSWEVNYIPCGEALCDMPALYQVFSQDIPDAMWLQVCTAHIGQAVHETADRVEVARAGMQPTLPRSAINWVHVAPHYWQWTDPDGHVFSVLRASQDGVPVMYLCRRDDEVFGQTDVDEIAALQLAEDMIHMPPVEWTS